MADQARRKLYTVAEARALVPQLRALLTALQTEKQNLDVEAEKLAALTPAMRANGHAIEAATIERQIETLALSMQQKLDEITSLDIEVKDIGAGLVDFLSVKNGEVVYLCWRVDEPTVMYWHHVDAGFRGRQPLDE